LAKRKSGFRRPRRQSTAASKLALRDNLIHTAKSSTLIRERGGRGSKARLAELGAEGVPMTPAQFGEYLANETAKWAKVIKAAGLKAE
jgi:hypothetical protein